MKITAGNPGLPDHCAGIVDGIRRTVVASECAQRNHRTIGIEERNGTGVAHSQGLPNDLPVLIEVGSTAVGTAQGTQVVEYSIAVEKRVGCGTRVSLSRNLTGRVYRLAYADGSAESSQIANSARIVNKGMRRVDCVVEETSEFAVRAQREYLVAAEAKWRQIGDSEAGVPASQGIRRGKDWHREEQRISEPAQKAFVHSSLLHAVSCF